jgi:hypothetical protein
MVVYLQQVHHRDSFDTDWVIHSGLAASNSPDGKSISGRESTRQF